MVLEELERELRAERPEPDHEFARELDEWAAAGFPRRDDLDPSRRSPGRRGLAVPDWLRGVRERLAATPPRRLLAPAGAALTLTVVAAVAITRVGELDTGGDGAAPVSAPPSTRQAEGPPEGGEPLQPAPSPLPDAGGAATEALGGGAALDRAEGFAAESAREIGPAGRRIAQRVDLAIATPPADFRDAADRVLDVVRDHRGFVVRSSVSGGDPDVEGAEQGNASFQLRIPAVRLQSAQAALSDLGHVVSRTDGTTDITSRFTSAQRRIEGLSREQSRLLERLEDADNQAVRRSIRAQVRIVNAGLADAEDDLARAQSRVRMVPVSVSIVADPAVEGEDDAGWGVDDAADDAVDVLRFIAGVALVSAAVLIPLGLIAAAAWLVATRARTRARERALDAR
jgi:hypothetical protein